jgi:hypothetical protein
LILDRRILSADDADEADEAEIFLSASSADKMILNPKQALGSRF